jgi:hypothetical protein
VSRAHHCLRCIYQRRSGSYPVHIVILKNLWKSCNVAQHHATPRQKPTAYAAARHTWIRLAALFRRPFRIKIFYSQYVQTPFAKMKRIHIDICCSTILPRVVFIVSSVAAGVALESLRTRTVQIPRRVTAVQAQISISPNRVHQSTEAWRKPALFCLRNGGRTGLHSVRLRTSAYSRRRCVAIKPTRMQRRGASLHRD